MLWYNTRMKRPPQTRYPKSVKPSKDQNILKPSSNNAKLGYIVSKGKHRGKRIYSVSLQERATCPTSCHHWEDCYGDNMPFALRYDTKGLMQAISKQLETLMKKHKQGILVRLHVLGDFYSVPYVRFWADQMIKYGDKLAIFGYTARNKGKIYNEIRLLNMRFSERCVIRLSRNEEFDIMDAFQSYAAEESFEGKSFDCPEQVGKVKSCADCSLCWTTQKTVRFASH